MKGGSPSNPGGIVEYLDARRWQELGWDYSKNNLEPETYHFHKSFFRLYSNSHALPWQIEHEFSLMSSPVTSPISNQNRSWPGSLFQICSCTRHILSNAVYQICSVCLLLTGCAPALSYMTSGWKQQSLQLIARWVSAPSALCYYHSVLPVFVL